MLVCGHVCKEQTVMPPDECSASTVYAHKVGVVIQARSHSGKKRKEHLSETHLEKNQQNTFNYDACTHGVCIHIIPCVHMVYVFILLQQIKAHTVLIFSKHTYPLSLKVSQPHRRVPCKRLPCITKQFWVGHVRLHGDQSIEVYIKEILNTHDQLCIYMAQYIGGSLVPNISAVPSTHYAIAYTAFSPLLQ